MNVLSAIMAFCLGVAAFGGLYYIFDYALDLVFDNITFYYASLYNLIRFLLALIPAAFVFLWGLRNINLTPGGDYL